MTCHMGADVFRQGTVANAMIRVDRRLLLEPQRRNGSMRHESALMCAHPKRMLCWIADTGLDFGRLCRCEPQLQKLVAREVE